MHDAFVASNPHGVDLIFASCVQATAVLRMENQRHGTAVAKIGFDAISLEHIELLMYFCFVHQQQQLQLCFARRTVELCQNGAMDSCCGLPIYVYVANAIMQQDRLVSVRIYTCIITLLLYASFSDLLSSLKTVSLKCYERLSLQGN